MSDPRERIAELEQTLDGVESFEQALATTYADLEKYKRLLSKRLSILKGAAVEQAHAQERPLQAALQDGGGLDVARASVSGLRGSKAESSRSGLFRKAPAVEETPAEPVIPATAPRPDSASGTFRKPPGSSSGIRTAPAGGGSADGQTVIRKAPAELMAALPNAGGPAAPTTGQRTAPRRAGNPVPILISVPNGTGEPLQGWVLDRSSGGLRVLIDQSFKPGATLSVRPTKAHSSFPWIEVEVRSCQPERGSFNVGCQFVRKLTWAELQMFG